MAGRDGRTLLDKNKNERDEDAIFCLNKRWHLLFFLFCLMNPLSYLMLSNGGEGLEHRTLLLLLLLLLLLIRTGLLLSKKKKVESNFERDSLTKIFNAFIGIGR
jgi:hypothetical protein